MDFYKKSKDFAKEFIDPIAQELDKNNQFPNQIFDQLGEHGFFNLIIPEELGGDGKGYKEHAQIIQALAESNASVGLSYMMHNVPLSYVLTFGNDQLKKEIVDDILNNSVSLALGGTESGHGVDMSKSDFNVKSENESIFLTGSKHMVTGGGYAKWYMINAPHNSEPNQMAQYFVSKEMNGVQFEEGEWDALGMRANNSIPMILDQVEIPDYLKLVPDERVRNNYYFTLGLAAVYTGLNKAILEEVQNHVNSRTYPDRSTLADIETVKIHLSELYTNTFESIACLNEAAQAADEQKSDAGLLVNAARVIASENAIDSSNVAMRVGGGKSYNRANAIERYMRDAYAGPIMTPSVDVLRLAIGGSFSQ